MSRTAYWVETHRGDYFISPSSPPSQLSDRPNTPSDVDSSHSDPPRMILRYVSGPDDAINGRYRNAKYGTSSRSQEASTYRSRRHSGRSTLSQPEQIRVLPANYPIHHHPPMRSTTTNAVANPATATPQGPGPVRQPVHTGSSAHPRNHTHQVSHSYSHPSALPQTHTGPVNSCYQPPYSKRPPQQTRAAYGSQYPGSRRPPDHSYHAFHAQQTQAEGPTLIHYTQSAPLPHQYRRDYTGPVGRSSVDANDRYRPHRQRTYSSGVRAEEYIDRSAYSRHKRTFTSENIPQTSINGVHMANGGTLPTSTPVIPDYQKMNLFQRIRFKFSSSSDSTKRNGRTSMRLRRRHSTDGAPLRSAMKGSR